MSADPEDFTDLPDLAGERLGGAVLAANDEFFAPKEALLKEGEPVDLPGEYTDRGKWMDGWETRRRRQPGHDWCLIRLGLAGVVRGVVVDTRHFRGNYPPEASLEGTDVAGQPTPDDLTADDVAWVELLPRSPLVGDGLNLFPVAAAPPATADEPPPRVTHLRFHIYPDGGVARLRVHGEVLPDWADLARRGGEIDLAGVEQGGRVVAASDMFFGNRHHLILPGPPRGMHDGWETRRRRGPGNDWAIVRLGARGTVRRAEVDTSFFRGNAPGRCSLEGIDAGAGPPPPDAVWRPLLPPTPLQPHTLHRFDALADSGPLTHVRLSIFPDGGVARLRLFGPVPEPAPR